MSAALINGTLNNCTVLTATTTGALSVAGTATLGDLTLTAHSQINTLQTTTAEADLVAEDLKIDSGSINALDTPNLTFGDNTQTTAFNPPNNTSPVYGQNFSVYYCPCTTGQPNAAANFTFPQKANYNYVARITCATPGGTPPYGTEITCVAGNDGQGTDYLWGSSSLIISPVGAPPGAPINNAPTSNTSTFTMPIGNNTGTAGYYTGSMDVMMKWTALTTDTFNFTFNITYATTSITAPYYSVVVYC
jgi:hypothetical protein